MENINLVWTIILSFVVGVGANILTPFIFRIWARFSESTRIRNEKNGETFRRTVQYLLENPSDDTNRRIAEYTFLILAIVSSAATIILLYSSNGLNSMVFSLLFAFLAIVSTIILMGSSRLGVAVREEKKKKHPDIDPSVL